MRIRLLLVVVGFCLLAHDGRLGARASGQDVPDAESADAESALVVDPSWPQKPAEFTWGNMPGVAVDAQDRVYIFTRNRPEVQIYQSDGTFVRAWRNDAFKAAHHIKVDHQGNVWIADIGSHVVQKYTPEGKLLLSLGTVGESGCDETHFDQPTDVAVLPGGDVFVSDGYGNRRVAHFDGQGEFVKQWGAEGTGPGQFALPHAIVADGRQRLYVADRENSRIQVFDTSGKVLAVWDRLLTPWGLFMAANDDLWVCGSSLMQGDGPGPWRVVPPKDQVVMKLSLSGKPLARFPLPKTAAGPGKPGELNWVHGIALDRDGNLYLGDIQGKRAQKFLRRAEK